MRTVLLALLLSFGTSQAVAWNDCCCGSFCQHKNACTGCGPEDSCPGAQQKPASCCDEDGSAPNTTCSHLEPASEIDTRSTEVDVGPTTAAVTLVELESPATTGTPPRLPRVDTGPPRAGPQHAVPLHLYHSVLLV